MRQLRKHILTLAIAAFMLLTGSKLFAQEMVITNIELKGGDVHVTYSLIDSDVNRRYSVYLYTSRDNYLQPLNLVEGNIGVDQTVGSGKLVIWHAREEFGSAFKEDISLELKGNIYVPFINLVEFNEGQVIKRTTPYELTWAGGRGENVLTIELFKGDERMHIFGEEPGSTGAATLVIPAKMKPGSDYRLKISDKSNRDEVIYSPQFEVKRKIPQVYRISGGVVLLGLAAIILDAVLPEPDIPPPPLPDGNG